MGKFIITEEDRKLIRGLYGLNEQTITLPLPISDTFDSNDGDSAHRLTVFENKVDNAIEQIYNQGINPKMYDLSFNVVPNGNTFTTTVSLVINKSDDGKAWTGFASRGSYGFNYEKRADDQITGKGNKDGRSLKEKLESGADAVKIIPISNSPITIRNATVKQYFFQFTKSLKPSHTTPKPNTQPSQPKTQTGYEDYTDDEPTTPQPSQPTQPTPTTPQNTVVEEFKISATNLNTLYDDFKKKVNDYIIKEGNNNYNIHRYFSVSSKDGITINVWVNLYPDENGYNRFSLLFNEKGNDQESLDLALGKNPDSKEIKNGTITVELEGRGLVEHEWHLVGLHV